MKRGEGDRDDHNGETTERLRILCLHGKHQCGEIFSQKVRALTKKAKGLATFAFVDAPFALPLRDGQSVPMRTWSNSTVPKHQQWDRSLHMVTELVEKHSYDGILSFSQGGCVASQLASQINRNAALNSLRFFIFAGSLLPDARQQRAAVSTTDSLHFMGRSDRVVSVQKSQDLARTFQTPQVHLHEGGHIVPQKRKEMAVMLAFLKSQRDRSSARTISGYVPVPEEQSDELEALESIFEGAFELIHEGSAERCPEMCVRVFEDVDFEDVDDSNLSTDLESMLLKLRLRFRFVQRYPESAIPYVEFEDDRSLFLRLAALRAPPRLLDKSAMANDIRETILRDMTKEAKRLMGEPMVFDLVSWVKDAMIQLARDSTQFKNDRSDRTRHEDDCAVKVQERGEHDDDVITRFVDLTEDEEKKIVREVTDEAMSMASKTSYVSRRTGEWNYTVGLIGKPSAGKSTFFNCVTSHTTVKEHVSGQSGHAKIGGFPFTTIEPNVGTAFFSAAGPEMSSERFEKTVDRDKIRSRYGMSSTGHRLVRIKVKDVAGLVPGACKGKGRGNAFLNDLCDADVLIHIVDASATTDNTGNSSLATEDKALVHDASSSSSASPSSLEIGDPVHDVDWIRNELHRWIYGNIRLKWSSIERKPRKLPEMFSGYHATPDVALEAIRRAGGDISDLDNDVRTWEHPARMLHCIVAHFLQLRFPIVLALNKADLPSASRHVRRIRDAYPRESAVVTSAALEWQCRQWEQKGIIRAFAPGSKIVEIAEKHVENVALVKKVRAISSFLQRSTNGTGVLSVIDVAISLRPPTIVYPVASVKTCVSLSDPSTFIRDVILMHPSSTCEDLYTTLKRPPHNLLRGDFVRAECRNGDGQCRPMKKSEILRDRKGEENNIVSISVNRKVSWQKRSPNCT